MIVMHPGEYIVEAYLDAEVFTRNELADRLRVSQATVSRILSSKAMVTPEMAVRLERVLGRSAKSWMAMQADYDLAQVYENTN